MSNECMSLPPLKPCPFCGGLDLDYSQKRVQCDHGRNTRFHSAVYCRKCNAYGRRVLSEKAWSRDYEALKRITVGLREKAIEAWNRRAGESNEV